VNSSSLYLLAADAALSLHVLFVAFVVVGLIVIFVGCAFSWPWIRDPIFRSVHLLAIGSVAAQSWFGMVCPLTTIEIAFRARAGDATYSGTFISHWLQKLLYYQAPDWVFIACYTAFGTLVAITWYFIRPRPFRTQQNALKA